MGIIICIFNDISYKFVKVFFKTSCILPCINEVTSYKMFLVSTWTFVVYREQRRCRHQTIIIINKIFCEEAPVTQKWFSWGSSKIINISLKGLNIR